MGKIPHFKLCLVSFPYSSTRHTGRGLDRYTCELADNVSEQYPGIDVRLLDEGSLPSVWAAGKKVVSFTRHLFAHGADVYHAISPLGGAMLAGLQRKPLVVTIHDVIPFNVDAGYDSPLKYSYWRQCIRLCVDKSAAIIVPYQVTKDEIVSRLHGDPSKIYVINHGVDHAKYFPRPELTRAPRKIVYLGEVSRSKGVDMLLRAYALLKREVPDAELVIAGKRSKDEQLLQELSRNLGVDGIELRGYISEAELSEYYGTATVMVFPSRCGFGLSTLEAMACGTPVVALAVLDAPEFIGDAGLLADPDSDQDLADKLKRALTDTELQAELTRKGIARAAEFSWRRMGERTAKVYQDVLQQRTTGLVD